MTSAMKDQLASTYPNLCQPGVDLLSRIAETAHRSRHRRMMTAGLCLLTCMAAAAVIIAGGSRDESPTQLGTFGSDPSVVTSLPSDQPTTALPNAVSTSLPPGVHSIAELDSVPVTAEEVRVWAGSTSDGTPLFRVVDAAWFRERATQLSDAARGLEPEYVYSYALDIDGNVVPVWRCPAHQAIDLLSPITASPGAECDPLR